MSEFSTESEVIDYLIKETKLSKEERSEAYHFIMRLDLEKIKRCCELE